MPELPEVETVRRGVEPHVLGRRFAGAIVRETRLRWPVEAGLDAALRERTVVATERRGKYLLLVLDNDDRLLIHLGMSGRLFVLRGDEPLRKHDHVDLVLDRGRLRFNDPRRFGAILLWRAGEPLHPLLASLGPEPFSAAFNGDYLFELSRGRRAPVKTFLMDGGVVVGAGNIYAAESLFRAGIRPTRAAGSVSRARYARLAETVREVLSAAIEQGGTTLRDYAGADGAPGYFQQVLDVYGREHEPCHRCGATIRRQVIGQRSSFYCPGCQT